MSIVVIQRRTQGHSDDKYEGSEDAPPSRIQASDFLITDRPLKSTHSHQLGLPKALKQERNYLWKSLHVYPSRRISSSDLNPWNGFDAWLIAVSLTCLQTPWQLCRLSHCWRWTPQASCIQMGSLESRDALVVQRIVWGHRPKKLSPFTFCLSSPSAFYIKRNRLNFHMADTST